MIFKFNQVRDTFIFIAVFGICINWSFGQKYFQQEVNYEINVRLDVAAHFLHGNISIEYINNAPDKLDKIYMHLWPNAYSAPNTAFALDMVKRGDASFHFANERDYGYIDSLDFKIDGKSINVINSIINPDIALLILDKDLKPQDTLVISTSFRVKIPKSFSRLGYTKDAHQITQWYPKPAVYDQYGWHQMPYLAIGEFYSEFGDYKVKITVPENQIVAATGSLQDQEELYWLSTLHGDNTVVNSRSKSSFKTLSYTAEKVHDFAWFTNPNFQVEHEVISISDQDIDLWSFYTKDQESLWKNNALEYAKNSTIFFSHTIGAYPYPSISIVNSPLQAGGGMEYPMITTIDQVRDTYELDHVIAHEIGHFWFYGVLGINERMHAWMDEGLTSYYDHDYFFEKYGEDHFLSYLPRQLKKHFHRSLAAEGYLAQASRHLDQGMNVALSELSMENYILGAYAKPAISFYYLEQYIGKEKLDQSLKSFFEKWKFKHPYPDDLKLHLEKILEKNLDWFFDGLLMTDGYVDYAIGDFDLALNAVTIENRGSISAAFKIKLIKDETILKEEWIQGFSQDTTIVLAQGDFDRIMVGADFYDLDIDLSNNHYKTKGLWKKLEGTSLGMWGGPNNLKSNKSYWLPSLGFNAYDGLQLGLVNYSAFVPARAWQDILVANYGLNSKRIVGLYKFRFNKYFDRDRPSFLHGDLELKRYNYNHFDKFDKSILYSRISPSVSYHLKQGHHDPRSHSFKYQMHVLNEETPIFSNDSLVIRKQWSNIQQLEYHFDRPHVLYPYEYQVKLEYANYKNSAFENHNYLKLDMMFKVDMQYKPSKYFQFRFYGAKFITNSQRSVGSTSSRLVKGAIPITYQGFNDNYYEQYFFGRSEQEGLWSRQILINEGGFKTATTSSFNTVGQSNDYLYSMNLKSDLPFDLPFGLPLKAFFDVAQFNTKGSTDRQLSSKTLYSLGLALEFGDGAFGLYLPLLNATEINTALDNRGGLFSHWSFSLDFTKFNIWKVHDKFGW